MSRSTPRATRATTPPRCEYGCRPIPCAPITSRSYSRPDDPATFSSAVSSSATMRPSAPSRTSPRTCSPPPECPAALLAALLDLVEERVGDELEALLDQLVVDLALPLDLFRRLELRGKA